MVIARRKRAVRARLRDGRSRTETYARKKDVFWLLFGVYQKVARCPQDSGSLWIVDEQSHWIPAFAGMTSKGKRLDSSFRWNDD
jgi:hypothetical protein